MNENPPVQTRLELAGMNIILISDSNIELPSLTAFTCGKKSFNNIEHVSLLSKIATIYYLDFPRSQ